MKTRLTIFLAIVAITFVPAATTAGRWQMPTVAFGWFIVVNLVTVFLFRCPSCLRHAW